MGGEHQAVTAAEETIITGTIFCDNYFEFYFNGDLIMKDPLDFTPNQAVNVSFTWDGKSDMLYAILCQDYMNLDVGATGFEYVDVPIWNDEIGTCCFMNADTLKLDDCYGNMTQEACPTSCASNKRLGSWEAPDGFSPSDRWPLGCGPWICYGSLLAEFSDGTKTTKDWKVFSTAFGPTTESILNGCSYKDFNECQVDIVPAPECWNCQDFDDSEWFQASEFTVEEAGWGRSPRYNDTTGECCGLRTQRRKAEDHECVSLPKIRCLNPKEVRCSKEGGSICPGANCKNDGPQCDRPEDPRMIWASDLQRDQHVLFRYSVTAGERRWQPWRRRDHPPHGQHTSIRIFSSKQRSQLDQSGIVACSHDGGHCSWLGWLPPYQLLILLQ